LIEMLIVVAIIALTVGVTFPALGSGIDSLRLASASDGVAGFLQGALTRVERRQRMMELTVSKGDNALVVAGEEFSRRYALEDGVTIAEILPAEPVDPTAPRRFLLYPGGAAPRIALRLVNRRGSQRMVSLDPITGVARVERIEAK
jgi:type II secretory pathway pseudopilin PulG